MILILTARDDPHADVVSAILTARGVPHVRFDPGDIPRDAEFSVDLDERGGLRRKIMRSEGEIDLEKVRCLWFRRPSRPTPLDSVCDEATRTYVMAECENVLDTLWDSLGCPSLPAPKPVFRRAETKLGQLMMAASVGFDIPATLLSNSPAAALDFRDANPHRLISKLPSGVVARSFGISQFFRFTEEVRRSDLLALHSLRHAPVIFQSYVDKAVELRVTVVGERVFAAEIHSQTTRHTKLDWRHYDSADTPVRHHDLPPDIARSCREVVGRFGLRYGAIDLIVTPEGRYVFVELNPNGQYLWIEQITQLPISDAIADELVAMSTQFQAAS